MALGATPGDTPDENVENRKKIEMFGNSIQIKMASLVCVFRLEIYLFIILFVCVHL